MRNLLEYPLTPTEVMIALDEAIDARASKQYIGDITLVGLHALKTLLQQCPDLARIAAEADRDRIVQAVNAAPNQDL